MKQLLEVLNGQGGNYLLPFFWQHGETEEKLREYMGAIHDCGIGEVCVECRPHPDFCGPQWWHDMDILLDEAKMRGMRLWILDDAHFPTGYANGALKTAPECLRKQYLDFSVQEIAGPLPDVCISPAFDGELISVTAVKAAADGIDNNSFIDLTPKLKNGQFFWDVPKGYWRIITAYKTRNGGGNPNYINLIDRDSVHALLNAVYEPHYAHYAADFGKTIAGFFSDEPQLGNITSYDPDNGIGKQMPLPWSAELETILKQRWGAMFSTRLPGLWFNGSGSAAVRLDYMDAVTSLVAKNFSEQIGGWCEAHGVQYIGHIIEDSGEHARLGQSTGHYFRSLYGQHMAGIDDIGGQVFPGGDEFIRSFAHQKNGEGPVDDGCFYHYALGEMAVSLAALDPRKRGDSLCEIFGAYGWSEGSRLMKRIADHFLVRGVNHYVPHAFSPKPFPDNDHPPHFYAHGLNPLYPAFGDLCRYVNRVCHLISGGRHTSPVALLYHAEAEWMDRGGDFLPSRIPAKTLSDAQINYDFVWEDVLTDDEHFPSTLGSTWKVGTQEYRALVIPQTAYLDGRIADFICKAQQAGFPVVFAGDKPQKLINASAKTEVAFRRILAELPSVPIADLAAFLNVFRDVSVEPAFRQLRTFHYTLPDGDLLLVSNESPCDVFSGRVSLPDHRCAFHYDPIQNRLIPAEDIIFLLPGELTVLCFPSARDVLSPLLSEPMKSCTNRTSIHGPWRVSFMDALRQSEGFTRARELSEIHSFSREYPDFSGWIAYETSFEGTSGRQTILELTEVYESAEVIINGHSAGRCICPPYRYNLTAFLQDGVNQLRIEVATTLERAASKLNRTSADPMAGFVFDKREKGILHPFGLLGTVTVLESEEYE